MPLTERERSPMRPGRPLSPLSIIQKRREQGKELGKFRQNSEIFRDTRPYSLQPSNSEPSLKFSWQEDRRFNDPRMICPGNNKTSYKIQWPHKIPDDLKPVPDPSQMNIKPQWYPKGLDVSLPRVKLYGIDPRYYDEPVKHKIDNRGKFGAHAAPPREVPKSAQKWHSQEGWNNPELRGTFKISARPPPPWQWA